MIILQSNLISPYDFEILRTIGDNFDLSKVQHTSKNFSLYPEYDLRKTNRETSEENNEIFFNHTKYLHLCDFLYRKIHVIGLVHIQAISHIRIKENRSVHLCHTELILLFYGCFHARDQYTRKIYHVWPV